MENKLSINEKRLRNQPHYGLYCVNMFGTGLNAIRNEFKRQVRTGLRPTVYVLDLDEIQNELNNQLQNSRHKREETTEDPNKHLMNAVLQHIQASFQDYETQKKRVDEEVKPGTYPIGNGRHKVETRRNAGNVNREAKRNSLPRESTLISKKHNRVGQSIALKPGKFISDEPIVGKLHIILLGQMDNFFYTDLLRQHQPLEGIINFIPAESSYDIMLGNNKLQRFIRTTLENLRSSIYSRRQDTTMKAVGLFSHEVPIISGCLAANHSRDIFDQLTWCIYDVEILRQQYETYYLEPFQVMDVELPPSTTLQQVWQAAAALRMHGHFRNSSYATCAADLASIAAYLNSLLRACSPPEDLLEQRRQIITAQAARLLKELPTDSFSVVLGGNNKLLLNLLQYTDCNTTLPIYLCCLDYNEFRQYTMLPPEHSATISTDDQVVLPQYVQYYADGDCCSQRVFELLGQYDDYEVRNLGPGYKLYSFNRSYNVLKEKEGRCIIPTRLCFRDFTLFQMEEFLKYTKRPDLNTTSIPDTDEQTAQFEDDIFIRMNSIKTRTGKKESTEEIKLTLVEQNGKQVRTEAKTDLHQALIKTQSSLELPVGSGLLTGYNLDDTLQEIKYKTSQYSFRQGFVQLYEEKWCFKEMNAQLSLSINNATLYLSRPHNDLKGISNNMRLITKNQISLRILNDLQECSKIVMNYPNGLSVFHHEDHCEQVWCCDETVDKEHRRIFTNCGAIIIFFKSHGLITILRYNGEVYRLYQHELPKEEEDQTSASNLEDIKEKSSELGEFRSQSDSAISQSEHYRKQPIGEAFPLDAADANCSQKLSSKRSFNSSTTKNYSKSSISYQLQFLTSLCSTYDLTYSHLVITTSQGKRFKQTHHAEILEARACSIQEWHDYFADESYCDRSDGVKMIWTQNYFKCFHCDGAVFTTTLEECTLEADVDEFESEISQSSSHSEIAAVDNNRLFKNEPQLFEVGSLSNHAEDAEEHTPQDTQILHYECKSWFMQHPSYAGVYVQGSHIEIFGIDNLRIYTQTEEYEEEVDFLGSEHEAIGELKSQAQKLVTVWVGKDLCVKADVKGCTIFARVPQSKNESATESQSLTLSLKYTDCIIAAFKHIVEQIVKVEHLKEQDLQQLHFVRRKNTDLSVTGFEFLQSLPLTSEYVYRAGNSITELKRVHTLKESMLHHCEEHRREINKFPRFRQAENAKCRPKHEPPRILSANVFIEIPKQLLSLAHITKFLEPFENIRSKSIRAKFKTSLDYFLKPQQQVHIKIISSRARWRKRHCEHKRRLFNEKQRLGLYSAMKKHEVYPNYWIFSQTCGNQLQHVDFFNFMQNRCENM